MTKTRFRVSATLLAAALALGACSNGDDSTPEVDTTPTETTTVDPTDEPTDDPTDEPTEDPTDEPTDPAPSGDRPTNSPVEQLSLDQCQPLIEAFQELGTLSGDMQNTDDPEAFVASYARASELLNDVEPLPGMEEDLWVLQEFYASYDEVLDPSMTTDAELEAAMMELFATLDAKGIALQDGLESVNNINVWAEEACV